MEDEIIIIFIALLIYLKLVLTNMIK